MKKTAFLFLACCAFILTAEVRIDPVFSSDMVLQQEKPIVFFGTCAKDDKVSVEFAGKKTAAEQDGKGNWKAVFPAMKASYTAYAAVISDGKKSLRLENLLIGDVWFCSGQSNMQMPIGAMPKDNWSAANCVEEVKNSSNPYLRVAQQLRTKGENQPRPAALQYGKWVVSSPKYAAEFSAAAYFFGRALQKELNIPVGLIHASWGGTRIQPWISPEAYGKAGLKNELDLLRKFDMTPEEKTAYEKKEWSRFASEMSALEAMLEKHGAEKKAECAGYSEENFDDSGWEKADPDRNSSNVQVRWYRVRFKLDPAMKGKSLRIQAGGIPAEGAEVWLNGKQILSWKPGVSDGRKFLDKWLPAALFRQEGENVLAVRGIYVYQWPSVDQLRNLVRKTRVISPTDKQLLTGWKERTEYTCKYKKYKVELPRKPDLFFKNVQMPATLFNGMVRSWTRLPIRGVIWYQGCSNAGNPRYYLLHKALIADWRAQWKEPGLPFLIVQLAGYGDRNWQTTPPSDARYALTRDIQLQMVKIPNVGLAATIDIGHPAFIHPANKQDVGKRLSLEAFRIAYGRKIVSRGPLFREAKPEGKTVRVFFDNADSGLVTTDGKAPRGFAVAGADKKFVWAEAEISGKSVVVRSPSVPEPKFVRYAYAAYRGDLNLQNREGLPAYPFRSDAYDYASVK